MEFVFPLLISTGHLNENQLSGQVVVITGAGRGIGFETARSLAWLGARLILAEIDPQTGQQAADRINQEFGRLVSRFIQTDVGDEASVRQLAEQADREFGHVDVVINNACAVRYGAIHQTRIEDWDFCYRVNLRGPVLMAQAFLPAMLARKQGVIVNVVSKGEAFMGPYESTKAAQGHLSDVLSAELEGSGVIAFAIGPGLVRTPGAEEAIRDIAPMYGKSIDEFYEMSRSHILSVEAAGAGFAAAVALAESFAGQETSSIQALIQAGISVETGEAEQTDVNLTEDRRQKILAKVELIRTTLAEQAAGWQKRPIFERQWVVRDFRKSAGMPVEQWLSTLDRLAAALRSPEPESYRSIHAPVEQLVQYFVHTCDLYRGYEKNPQKLAETLPVIQGWEAEARQLMDLLKEN